MATIPSWPIAAGEQVEQHERRGPLLSEHADPRGGRVDPLEQLVERQPLRAHDHELAVGDEPLGRHGIQCG